MVPMIGKDGIEALRGKARPMVPTVLLNLLLWRFLTMNAWDLVELQGI